MEEDLYKLYIPLLFFYLTVINAFIPKIFSNQLNLYLDSSLIIQYIFSFIYLFIIITIFYKKSLYESLFLSIIGYLWFYSTTKSDIQFNLIIIFIMVIGFLYYYNSNKKLNNLYLDKSIDNIIINKQKILINKNNKNISFIILLISSISFFLYYNKKVEQFGGNFNTQKFFTY